ncbi:MAG TPA: 2-hydroxyacyl-CoA dehydratase family protein, partial [Candidatus Limnocylindrales bacterium]|nr:2-hydroxyacyl-CoA dehydratase family protein [Candidatus Limnocylindrales bacterium]
MSTCGAEDALRFAGRTSSDPARAISRWKALTGGKAAGCFPLYIPEEVLHAAGMLPVTVCGDEYLDVPASRPWEILDGWVLPPVSGLPPESVNFLPEAFSGLPQVSLSFSPRRMKVPSAEETLDRVELLREWAGDVAGRPATDGALGKSLSIFNENRKFFSALEERLAATPGAYSAVEVFRLLRSAMALPREAHTELLRAALTRNPARGRQFRAKIFLGGMAAFLPVMEAIDADGSVL